MKRRLEEIEMEARRFTGAGASASSDFGEDSFSTLAMARPLKRRKRIKVPLTKPQPSPFAPYATEPFQSAAWTSPSKEEEEEEEPSMTPAPQTVQRACTCQPVFTDAGEVQVPFTCSSTSTQY